MIRSFLRHSLARPRAVGFLLVSLVACLLPGAGAPAVVNAATTQSPRPPNVVVILADDMGWNQVGYHGSTFYETPHLDRLAAQGMQFRQAYSAAPICSPTRAALMTGRAPARLHLTDYIPGRTWEDKPLVTPQMQQGLPLAEVTLPERLRTRGYTSGLFGKWHLAATYDYAPGRPMDPESQGFDVVYHTNKPDEENLTKPDAHNAESITDQAIAFIRQQRDRPFFCYVAHNVVHRPLTESPERIEKYRRKAGAQLPENVPVMGAMIERMDTGIGRLLATLAELGLEASTVVVFASDNGNVIADQSQAPFRGGKATLWEGGIRVPLLVRWPGRVAPGTRSELPVITHDLFSTLLDLTGTEFDRSRVDGTSLLPWLTGQAGHSTRGPLFWHYPHYHHLGDMRPAGAMRDGRFKLIEWYEGALLGRGPVASLFDLEQDPGETRDLAAAQPERTEAMLAQLRQWRRDVGAQEMSVRERRP
ncbi:MAG: sulfatase [Opitutaceae bacterium]